MKKEIIQKLNSYAPHSFLKEKYKIRLSLLLFIMLGFIVRVYKLADHNLWFDEFISLYSAERLILRYLVSDLQPFLYYVLLRLWTEYFGGSEFALRSLSMFFGLLSIPLIYKLGKLHFDARTGLIGAFILTISPLHIWYSQEARGYALSTFLVMLIFYFLCLFLKTNKINYWLTFIITLAIGLYTNYFTLLIIFITTILFLQKEYRWLLKRWLIGCFFIFALFSLWLPFFLKQADSVAMIFWIPKPQLRSILITFENFNVGYNATPNTYFFTFMVFSSLFILGIQRWWKEEREELISLITFIFIPIIFIFLISQIMPIYLDRQLMLFSPFYYIIIAAGLRKIKMPIIKIATYFSILLPTIFCLHNYFSYHIPLPQYHHIGVHAKKPVKPAADYIKDRFEKGDIFAFSDRSIFNILYYMYEIYYVGSERLAWSFVIESELKNDKSLYKQIRESFSFPSNVVQIENGPVIPGARHIKELKFKRIWLISSSWAKDGNLDSHTKAVRDWMNVHYKLLDSKEFYGIFVDLYTKKIQ